MANFPTSGLQVVVTQCGLNLITIYHINVVLTSTLLPMLFQNIFPKPITTTLDRNRLYIKYYIIYWYEKRFSPRPLVIYCLYDLNVILYQMFCHNRFCMFKWVWLSNYFSFELIAWHSLNRSSRILNEN